MKIERQPQQKIMVFVLTMLAWVIMILAPVSQAADPPAPSPTVEEKGGDVEGRGLPRVIDPLPLPHLPNPVLALTGEEKYQANGQTFIRYKLAVTNHTAYPDAMFAPAPKLPPCGQNTNSSRTWVDIFDQTGKRLYGFCALHSSNDLVNLWFAVAAGQPAPPQVDVVLHDRQTNRQYKSNLVPIQSVAALTKADCTGLGCKAVTDNTCKDVGGLRERCDCGKGPGLCINEVK